ncbi:4-aminobutyrate--2-oxoglutarate transaminase [Aminobacter sp. SR38]|jgi:4-aminobutyrate aminotransferase/(S)-3-amino-2-methylpropionate transaminase|uniref:4-aminobutyrate--2-oxoglutarate transaminase n=1 Tax=Aminobacter sp. SR38 TaxID=2774562 RepID=UPI00177C3A9D|nr:4-aminobutyrate--2-oxoglutarate transaminase [Aminobacter sp. SR38]QOF72272.1 4-aminobutyrate--2-oxoglutarate transaminase [Aminobacter sp. SR38]
MTTNTTLLARRSAAVARGVATAFPVFAGKAEGAEIWDVEGRRYIDFAAGIAVLNTGHRHPKVIAAAKQQLDAYTHTAFQVLPYEPYVALCERLNALAPFSGEAKSLLFSTGAEAVENAIKIAKAATGRPGIIAFAGGFHGRTAMTMALTGKVAPYKQKFGISPAGVYHVPFPATPLDVDVSDALRALQLLFRADIAPSDVAAIIIEPVQGEGGFWPAPTELLAELRKICDTHGIVLIADEVQTGFARTGKMFGIEHSGIEPDIITVAKALGGGFPLAGVIGRAAIMDAAEPGGLGGTYAGNPVACAAALAVLDIIKDEGLVARANEIGATMHAALERMSQRNDAVPMASIRGPGAMIAFDIVTRRGTNTPDAEKTKKVVQAALGHGLVLLSCGVFGNTIRLLCPLTISDAQLKEGLDLLERALVSANA